MSWFDTHCHLHTFLHGQELETILERAEDANVSKMVTVGTSPEDWKDYEQLAQQYPERVYYSVGLHPGFVDENWKYQLLSIRNYWNNKIIPVALGEIGLDYFRLPKNRVEAEKTIFFQKEAFRAQLVLAKELACPVIIHSRSAFYDCVAEIDQSGVDWSKVVFHCFSEGVTEIRELTERGGNASFTGIVTFRKNYQLHEAIKVLGINDLMIETDCPYLTPEPYRGNRNEPALLIETGKFLAEFLCESVTKLMDATYCKSKSFYGII
jgi:TatD DNase family protein